MKSTRSLFTVTALFLAGLTMTSCRKTGALDGTYSSAVQSYTFHGDTVDASVMNKNIGDNWPYKVDGKKVTLTGPGGVVVLTMNDDGSLSDPANDKLMKK